jgi:hypothetical protein
MDPRTAHLADPAALVDALDPDAIQEALADLGRRASALRVLLRSARARQRSRRPAAPAPAPPEEDHHAE